MARMAISKATNVAPLANGDLPLAHSPSIRVENTERT